MITYIHDCLTTECCNFLYCGNLPTTFHLSLRASATLFSPCNGSGKRLTGSFVHLCFLLTCVAVCATCSLPSSLPTVSGQGLQADFIPDNRGGSFISCPIQPARWCSDAPYRSILGPEWLESKDLAYCSRLDNFTTASLHDMRFVDLTLRLGYPYLYCHCGDCEHVMIFQQVR